MPDMKSITEDAAETLQVNGACLEKAAKLYEEVQETKAAVAKEAREAAKIAVDQGRIDAEDLDGCADALLDHKKAVMLFKFACQHRLPSEQPSDVPATQVDSHGRPAVKRASIRVVGQRSFSDEPDEKDIEFDRAIGLAR